MAKQLQEKIGDIPSSVINTLTNKFTIQELLPRKIEK